MTAILRPWRRLWAWFLWTFLENHPRLRNWFLMLRGQRYPIFLEYRFESQARYGYGKPPHSGLTTILRRHHYEYEKQIALLVDLAAELKAIPHVSAANRPDLPAWQNPMLPPLDAISLLSIVKQQKPKRYFEVGSGNSTKFVHWAIKRWSLETKITSIDPEPRAEIDALADRCLRQPLESVDLTIFDELEAGDVLFIDNSHRSFMNSDVTVSFLDVLPRLKPGIAVGFHDINIPWDYPNEVAERYYSEQYLLSAFLLGGGGNTRVIAPMFYFGVEESLARKLTPLWSALGLPSTSRGSAFWLLTTASLTQP